MSGSSTRPKTIMIIRHGEKPGDKELDEPGTSPDLSLQGSARAAALPALFLPAGTARACAICTNAQSTSFMDTYSNVKDPGGVARFPTPDFLFATADSRHSSRPRQTITPLAAALGLRINCTYSNKSDDITALAKALLSSADYAGKIILICWHHGQIETLATALNAAGATKWHGDVFDRVWQIDYNEGSNVPPSPIQQYGQKLLFGDETNVPPQPW